MEKFLKYVFAEDGDRTAIPDETQTSGDVSYEQGYSYDYERDQSTDSLAKNIERDKLNAILYDITRAIQELQTAGVPDYITASLNGGDNFSYSLNALVRYDEKIYRSLTDGNTSLPTDATRWSELAVTVALSDALPVVDGVAAAGVAAVAARSDHVHPTDSTRAPLTSPTFTGSVSVPTAAQFNASTLAANTAFVRRAQGSYRSIAAYGVSTALTADHVGQLVLINASGITYTLPAANAVAIGSTITVMAMAAGSTATLVPASSSDYIRVRGNIDVSTVTPTYGEMTTLVSDGANRWYYAGFEKIAPASLATAGYQKLPSGLILQWGSSTLTISSTSTWTKQAVTFPVAFPTACTSVMANVDSTSIGTSQPAGNSGLDQTAVDARSATGFSFWGYDTAETGANSFSYIAIGY